jgi:pyruvate/2-oxoglutarate dehydrogenase complex dihydrolipoamide dehydrogenase (E3) component
LSSANDFHIIWDNLAIGRRMAGWCPTACSLTRPWRGWDLSEAEARQQGIAVRIAKLPIAALLRTRTTSKTRGFMKALVAADSDRILGFAMLGADAGEVMAVVQTAMLAGMPYMGLRDAIVAHPTMAEGLGALFSNVPAQAVQ